MLPNHSSAARHITLCGILTALAIVLSIAEHFFPLDVIIPVPGLKLGLANVVTLFALTELRIRDALAITLCRVLVSALLLGSVTGFLFSLFGGLLSLFLMALLLRSVPRFFSLLGVSVAGAAAHNIGQILAAMIWMKTSAVLSYLPLLLVFSIPLGLVTGLTAFAVLSHMKKISSNV